MYSTEQLDNFKNIIRSFYQTNQSFFDYLNIFNENKEKIDINLLELLKFIVKDYSFSKDLTSISKKIIFNIIKPNETFHLENEMNHFNKVKLLYYHEEKEKIIIQKIEKAVNCGEPLLDLRGNKNDPYWTRILNDMNDEDYDEIIKNILVIREEMKKIIEKNGEKSNYSIQNIDEYIDLELIGKDLYYKSFHFINLFQYIYTFISFYIHPSLKQSLENSKNEYFKILNEDLIDIHNTSNETTLELLKFIIDHFHVYIEMNDCVDIIST